MTTTMLQAAKNWWNRDGHFNEALYNAIKEIKNR